jgi:4,5-dihydroxyphthalate decarboxylase
MPAGLDDHRHRMNLQLTLACWGYDRTRPILDGRVKFDGIDAVCLDLIVEETFFRQMRYREFDVSEMSFSSYLLSRFADDQPFIAIPVFLSRSFRHTGIYVNTNAGIREPKDLVGKRVGCAEYQLTANVWIRGILNDDYGVAPSSYLTLAGGLEEKGRVEKAAVSLPPEIRIEPIGPDQTLSAMLESGEIDALFSPRAPSSFARGSRTVRRLFEDTYAAERDYYERTRIFPIMHVVAIRRELYERHRWIAQSLYKGFAKARQLALEDLHETAALKVMLPWLIRQLAETETLMGKDFWSYGYRANVDAIARLCRYHYEQGLSRRQLTPDEIFARETFESYKI